MRILLAALVAGCATAPDLPPPQRLAGCWASYDSGASVMRWAAPDPSHPNSLRGQKTDRRAGEAGISYFALDPDGAGFIFCELDDEQGATARCFEVAQGRQGSLEGGRAFIDQAGARLRLSIVGDGPERVLFAGRRSPC